MRARRWTVAAAVVIGVATAWPAAAGAATGSSDGKDRRTITVSATGLVQGTPDVLEMSMGVDTRSRSAAEALAHNSALAHKVIQALRDAGVSGDDIQTSDLSIEPVYDDNGNNVIAYSVTNLVDAKIHDLDKAGPVIDAATKIAGDEVVVYGVSFSFDDNSSLVSQARSDAVKRARAQAAELARAAGVQLGDLVSMSEDSEPQGPVVNAAPKAASGSDASVPVEPGSESLSVDVTLVFEIQ